MSSTILTVIVLVVMWLVVLVPMFVRRPDELPEDDEGTALSGPTSAARILAREQVTGYDEVETDVVERRADTEPQLDAGAQTDGDRADVGDDEANVGLGAGSGRGISSISSGAALRTACGVGGGVVRRADEPGEEVASQVYDDEFAGVGRSRRARARARARMIVRRRRVLAVLATLTLLTLIIAVLGDGQSWALGAQVLCDLLFVGYIVGLRREVRRERVRRAVRLARATAARARATARRSTYQQTRFLPQPAPRRSLPRGTPPRPRRGVVPPDPMLDEPDDPMEQRRVV